MKASINQARGNKVLAVIPARGGSKRLPGKNIRPLCGKPLVAYTVEAAKNSGLFDKVIVSTDSAAIAEVAVAYGAEVPFLRDAALADDFTVSSSVTVDVLKAMAQTETFRFVAQLLPTCPLRTAEDVVSSHEQFTRLDAEAQISLTSYGWLNPWWALSMDAEMRLESVNESFRQSRSQDVPTVYCPTGAIWWAKVPALLAHKTFNLPFRHGWLMPWHRAIDIDSKDDWQLAELIMEARLSGRFSG